MYVFTNLICVTFPRENSPLSNYASVPANNNPKLNRAVRESTANVLHRTSLASTSGYSRGLVTIVVYYEYTIKPRKQVHGLHFFSDKGLTLETSAPQPNLRQKAIPYPIDQNLYPAYLPTMRKKTGFFHN